MENVERERRRDVRVDERGKEGILDEVDELIEERTQDP